MNDSLLKNKYQKILNTLEKRIFEKQFEKELLDMQKVDLNYYKKRLTIEEMRFYLLKYKNKEYLENEFKNFQILLPGNPEIVFQVCLEAIRYDVNMIICIEDFCLAQNTFIVEFINQIIKDCKFKNVIEIKNLQKEEEIVEKTRKSDKTICIGNSNLYNRLDNKIENLFFYPYGIMEMYSDSEEFDELKKDIYEYSVQNQFEIDVYDDLEFEEAIEAINRDGYKFCSLLISKDKQKIKVFREKIDSKYVIENKNPFKEINFSLEIV